MRKKTIRRQNQYDPTLTADQIAEQIRRAIREQLPECRATVRAVASQFVPGEWQRPVLFVQDGCKLSATTDDDDR